MTPGCVNQSEEESSIGRVEKKEEVDGKEQEEGSDDDDDANGTEDREQGGDSVVEDEVDSAGYDERVMEEDGTGSMERVVGGNAMAVLLKVLITDDVESEERNLLSGVR